MASQSLLSSALLYLAAAVVVVPIAKRLGLGSVIGYLAAGIAVGPAAMGLVEDPEHILHFAEFGVVLLLFLIGLELNPRRLWSLRRPIFGLGGAQVLITTGVLTLAGVGLGLDWRAALVAGMGLSLSSTAIALQTLTEKNLLSTPGGSAGFSVLLFQDLAVIPMLALVPLLGPGAGSGDEATWLVSIKAVGAIAGIVVGGHFLLRPVFRYIAATGLREIFTAFSLLLVVGIAALMQSVGLSMALGSFLAGVLLAESEYRHAIETDIEPFKGLLLGLFFMSVGMSMDLALLLADHWLILGAVAALVGTKMAVLGLLARVAGMPPGQGSVFAAVLSQGGEFAFVLLAAASVAGVVVPALRDTLALVVALSMLTTPLLLAARQRLRRVPDSERPAPPDDEIGEQHSVIIAGFGRVGQIVARLLHANRIDTTVLDHDPDHIEQIRRFGFTVYYGDALRLDLLHAAGAGTASLLVIAIDDREQALKLAGHVREHFPRLRVLARAWDVVHYFDLRDCGVEDVEREAFEGSLRLGETALRRLGFGAYAAKQAAHRFRAHDAALLAKLYPIHREDIRKRVSVSAEARRELRALFEADEAALAERRGSGWE